jgi:hypothetical protein
MSATADILSKFDLGTLEKLRDAYDARHDRQKAADVRFAIDKLGVIQTEELSNCGKLFHHRNYDENTGRITHSWTGDSSVWRILFEHPGVPCRLDSEMCTGANSPEAKALAASRVTVQLKPGERVQVVKD